MCRVYYRTIKIFDFKLTSHAKSQPAITGREDSCFWLFSPWSRFGHALRPIFMLWLVNIWQLSSCGIFMQHLESCLLWQLKKTEFCVNLVFVVVFFVFLQNEILLLSEVFCHSWLVCLLSFWLRNTSLVNVGNPISDGIVFVFHLAWCVRGLKSLKQYLPLDSFSNGKPE